MSCCGKDWKQKIKQQCTKHSSERYKFFCAKDCCLQILCPQCIDGHKEAHVTFRQGQPQIYPLAEVQTFFQTKSSLQIEHQKKKLREAQEMDPCEVMCRLVDDYFYGSVDIKTENQKARNETMRNPTAKKFIQILEKESEYRLTQNFKFKYFQFLDDLLKDKEQKK